MEVNKSVKEAKNNDWGKLKLEHLRFKLKIAYVMYQCHNTLQSPSRHHRCATVMLALQDGSLLYFALPMVFWSLFHETC